ncbi:MAG: hypothetical protein QNJ16_17075 [Rhodobacter sp.]|nr:hypothetical protein [Rhodobacter sp.]
MTLDEIDASGLIREAYRIDGIGPAECRTIFVDWAIKLPAGVAPTAAIRCLLAEYGGDTAHPMTAVLREGLTAPPTPSRRGGRRGRRPEHLA